MRVGTSEGSLPLGEGGCPLGQTDEGREAVTAWHCRGGGMPRPLEVYTQNRRGVKASPGGEAFGRCNPAAPTAPHPVRLEPDHRSRGMTATGSHVHFYSLRGAQPPGEGFSLSRRLFRRFLPLKSPKLAHRGMPPPLQSIAISRYNAATFDLIRHAKRRDTVVEV